ncbi:hypothetical protein TVAG_392450 [Trichomonas vaginalis G3]|uniref:Uncharacterized protein n=1 Tax=Trichomonas vaginalis (strain ATCC PRA-98 / G3) TaxID=412133 RepID=A2DWU6_TRIV3|nr:spectrin binding [Trichomonas vaginalis G3]EAY15128.1 hypothetical protein TVAG_392450 [Trichomonas vaginalis G3]KAI5499180.1 spectrin binding [Trichomonas vaginalis G3]|eukprot:XP_001327351.1 hypothetical protein [Trichomonas vaginalis G3]
MNFDNPVLKLIQKPFKIDYDAQDKDGNTALIISAKMQKYEEAKLILEHGANPSIQNKDKISFIDIAKTNENLKGLITMPNDEYLDPADDSDEFLDAIKNFDILKVKSFLDKGYDPNKIQISKSNKVHPLEVCEDFEIFKLLIEGGSDFMFRYENENGKQKIPVFTIVSKRNKRFFDYMVEKGLNIKIKNEFNQSLLTHYASKNKDSEIMKFLMNKKVDYRRSKNNKGNLPIHYSCKHSNIDVVKLLIDKRSPINIANNNGELPIHLAVKYGTPDIVEILLENNSQFGSKDNQGNCPIHYSIESKFGKEMIETFVYCLIPKFDDIKSIIDIETEDKYTLLCKSLINNKNEISSYLIDLGSDVNYTMLNGNTPLILSLKNNPTPNIIHLLLSKGADINHFNQEGDFALKICESLEILHELLKFKPHLNNNECDVILNHICMLHLQIAGVLMMLIEKYNYIDCYKFAITLGLKKLVEFLIESGADVNCEDILGMTPINYATIHNKIEIAKYLIENGANLEHRDIEGNNAFGVAAKCARTSNQMIDLLLETCDILNTNYAGHSAVFVAIENKNFAFLQHIHEMRPYLLPQLVNEKGYDSYTPKILLVKNNWQYLLPLFDEEQFTYEIPIIMEEKLKDKEKYGDTDILCAIRNRYYTAFIHFYEEANPKPDLNETNKFGEFPLFVACYRDFSWRFINFLLDSGADPTKLYEGKTALRLCIENDFQNNVMHLIQHQTNDIQQKFENGMTYMHIAIKHGNPIFVRFLINANIYPKFVDDDGNSYLHYAALSDNKEIIRYILQYQKDCTLMNKEGMTPLMYAVQNRGFIFIEEYLKFNINFWIKCKDFYRSLYFSSLLNNDTFDYLLPYYQTIFN